MRRAARRVAVAVLAIATTSCARRVPRAHEVIIRNLAFEPTTLTVTQGDTVVWKNMDFVPHTATSREAGWDSKTIGANAEWRFVARTPGRHAYYCVFHPNMTGEIEVR